MMSCSLSSALSVHRVRSVRCTAKLFVCGAEVYAEQSKRFHAEFAEFAEFAELRKVTQSTLGLRA